jgi:pimeloyl-ACP methyl ester carboxylesterase
MRIRTALGLLLLVLALGACSPRAQEARLLLQDLAAGPAPSRLKETTPAPERSTVTFTADGQEHVADLYLPGRAPAPPAMRMVVVPGLSPEGRDDPRLVALARSLARVRFAVLVPEVPGLRRLQAGPEDVADIAAAIRHFADRPLPVPAPEGAVGLVAVSYAVGPALVAALDPPVAEDVAFLVSIGGYYDIVSAITYVTTGYYRETPEGPWLRGDPSPYAKWVFARRNVDRLEDPADREALAAMARRRLNDLAAPVDDLLGRMGPEGRSVYALIANTDPDAVPDLIDALPDDLRRAMTTLSPAAQDWSALRAYLYLIHGRDDPVIPATESERLAEAAGPERATLYLIDGLAHVELGDGLGLFDRLTLWRAATAVLAERDRLAGTPP